MSGAGAVGRGLAGAVVAGGCVAIETAPGGVQSVRFDSVPPSIVAGDVLRDATGAATVLRALAFDADGRPVATARVRFAYVPAADTANASRADTALVVDSLGAVRATLPLTQPRGRVAALVGERLQLLDTLDVVVAPDSLVLAPDTTPVLRYDCTDTRRSIFVASDTSVGFLYNAVALPSVAVRGDSAGTRVGVPSRLMRYEVDSTPFSPGPIPRVPATPGGTDSVPVIAVVGSAADRIRALDTTVTSTGASTVRLRIRPFALGGDAVPREFTVRVRARGQPGPRPLRNAPVDIRVRLARNPTPLAGRPATCQ